MNDLFLVDELQSCDQLIEVDASRRFREVSALTDATEKLTAAQQLEHDVAEKVVVEVFDQPNYVVMTLAQAKRFNLLRCVMVNAHYLNGISFSGVDGCARHAD